MRHPRHQTVYILFQSVAQARAWARWAAPRLAQARHQDAVRTRRRAARAVRQMVNVETVWQWEDKVFARTSAYGDVAKAARRYRLPVVGPPLVRALWGRLPPPNQPDQPPVLTQVDLTPERVRMSRHAPTVTAPTAVRVVAWGTILAAAGAGLAAALGWL